MKSVEFQPAYILHRRKYTDSKLILDLFTPDYGRVSGVIRAGSRKQNPVYQPFIGSLVSWQGRSELKTITHYETNGAPSALAGKRLFCGLYLNELIERTCPQGDAHLSLYVAYGKCLQSLSFLLGENLSKFEIETLLRRFEFLLLCELGYALSFDTECEFGQPIVADRFYELILGEGFRASATNNNPSAVSSLRYISGRDLLAIQADDYSDPQTLAVAKWITRQAIKQLIGHKPLKSRELFIS